MHSSETALTARPSDNRETSMTLPSIGLKASPVALPTRIAFVGNYLPRECGIATFTTDLCTALATEYGPKRLFVIPVNDPQSHYDYLAQVRLELEQEELASYERAADFLNFNGNDLVCLQHEYGLTRTQAQTRSMDYSAHKEHAK